MNPNDLLNKYPDLVNKWSDPSAAETEVKEMMRIMSQQEQEARDKEAWREHKRKYDQAFSFLGAEYDKNKKKVSTVSAYYFAKILPRETFWEFADVFNNEALNYTFEKYDVDYCTHKTRRMLADKLMVVWLKVDKDDPFHKMPLEWKVSVLFHEDAGRYGKVIEAYLEETVEYW